MSSKNLLDNVTEQDIVLYENGYLGQGAFAKCQLCSLKSDESQAKLVLKELLSPVKDSIKGISMNWVNKRLMREVQAMHKLSQERDEFVKVLCLFIKEGIFCGYVMEHCEHGSLRQFINRIENIIADFGLAKNIADSIATQQSLELEQRRTIERRVPEKYDDLLRQPDAYSDRYLYGICVVEAFSRQSIQRLVGQEVDKYTAMVKEGRHLKAFEDLLDKKCFDVATDKDEELEQLQSTVKQVVRLTAHQEPEKRADFDTICDCWRDCDNLRMEAERMFVQDLLHADSAEVEHSSMQQMSASDASDNRVEAGGANALEVVSSSSRAKAALQACIDAGSKNDPTMKTLAVKLFEFNDVSRTQWLVNHLVKEIALLNDLRQEREQFIRVYHLYSRDTKLSGFTMEYCRLGSIRSFSLHLSKLIADFGLSKKLTEANLSPQTLDFEQKRGIDKQLPETVSDPIRQPDQFSDRYLYGLLVVEAFTELSIREQISDNVRQFTDLLRSGKHVDYFQQLLNANCFVGVASSDGDLNRLKQAILQVVQIMSHHIPEQRASFSEVKETWSACSPDKMERARQEVLKLVRQELNESIAPDVKAPEVLWNTEVEFPEESLIGKGSFAVCHRCNLKSAPNDAPMALKIFKLDEQQDMSKKDWVVKHLVHEIKYMHDLGKKRGAFIKILYIYCHEVLKLVGYAMEYCKHGSLRVFSKRLSTMVSDGFEFLQNGDGGGILHRDLAVDNVLIDDQLNAKIADFGLSKRTVESIATQNTLAFERLRGVERRLPETYDDPLRQPDIFGDRYLYAVFVVEAFGQLSVRQVIGDRIEAFKGRVRIGQHIRDFQLLVDDSFFNKIPVRNWDADLEQLQKITKLVVEKMACQVPEQRATFSEISALWRMCSLTQMERERNRVLNELGELPPADTIPSAEVRARTVSLGPVEEELSVLERRSGAFTVSIGTVGGEMVSFYRPTGGSGSVRVSQHVTAGHQSDIVELLQRSYAEIVATTGLARRLCNSQDLSSKYRPVLENLGISAVNLELLQRQYTNPADLLHQGLLNLIRDRGLTVSQLAETLKRFGCLEGLKILREFELNPC
uniref:Protein kinase domain-containing protein n=1 Tax=Macrostomum lignano TaxID=282301 RepID=A0A1I8GF15_9PLAT